MRGLSSHQLQVLLEHGFPILPGFIVSSASCEAFFRHNDLWHHIDLLISRAHLEDPQDVAMVAGTIRKLILQSPLPPSVSDEFLTNFSKFGETALMITALPYRTLGVVGEANAILEIRSAWAAQFTPALIAKLARQPGSPPPVVVVSVQRQPTIIQSGVLFTSELGSDRKHECRIEVVWGEGAFADNFVGADTYWVQKQSGQEHEHQLSSQDQEIHFHHGEAFKDPVPEDRRHRRKLTIDQEQELSKLAGKIQQEFFFPQKVLWLSDGYRIYIASTIPDPRVGIAHQQETHRDHGAHVLLKGTGQTPGIVTGKVRIIRSPEDLDRVGHDDILVLRTISHIEPHILKRIRGVLLEEERVLESFLSLLSAHGVALISGATDASELLEPETFITLHTPSGEVRAGAYETAAKDTVLSSKKETMHVLPLEAIVSGTTIIKTLGHHPLKLLHDHQGNIISERVRSLLLKGNPEGERYYCLSDLTSAAYRHLIGSDAYETMPEHNPLLGLHGSARLLAQPQLAESELAALPKTIRSLKSPLFLILPSIRAPHEFGQWQRLLEHHGIERSSGLRLLAHVGTPAMAAMVSELARFGPDGVLFDVDRIHHFLMGTDPTSDTLLYPFEETNGPVLSLLSTTLQTLGELGIPVSFYGTLVPSDSLLSVAVAHGVRTLFVPDDTVTTTIERLRSLT